MKPIPAGVRFSPDLVYARTAARPLVLDLYLQERAPRPQPLIVYVHGGAFRAGNKRDCAEALKLLPGGFAVASIGYRLSQEALFPAQIRDVKAAVRWLRAHAAEYNLDPARFGAFGPSAGGHLVAMLGLSAQVSEWDAAGDHVESADASISSAVQAVCDWYGPTDFLRMNDRPGGMDHNAPDSPESQLIGGAVQDNPLLVARANPITYAHPAAPPFLICHGDQDPLVLHEQSNLLHQAIQKVGCQSTLVIVPGAGHGFKGKQYREMVGKAAQFFTAALPYIAGPAYRIETGRLVIRCYHPADAPLLNAAVNESLEHLRPWMPWAENHPTSIDADIALLRSFRASFDQGKDFTYGIFNADETRVLGGTGLHTRLGPNAREIGYWIHKDFINQGLATEVSAALTKVAFEVDRVDRVEIHCDPANVRSAAVPRKLGYTHDATLRKRLSQKDGSLRDTMVWSLLKDEYPASPAAQTKIKAYDAAGRCILK